MLGERGEGGAGDPEHPVRDECVGGLGWVERTASNVCGAVDEATVRAVGCIELIGVRKRLQSVFFFRRCFFLQAWKATCCPFEIFFNCITFCDSVSFSALLCCFGEIGSLVVLHQLCWCHQGFKRCQCVFTFQSCLLLS